MLNRSVEVPDGGFFALCTVPLSQHPVHVWQNINNRIHVTIVAYPVYRLLGALLESTNPLGLDANTPPAFDSGEKLRSRYCRERLITVPFCYFAFISPQPSQNLTLLAPRCGTSGLVNSQRS